MWRRGPCAACAGCAQDRTPGERRTRRCATHRDTELHARGAGSARRYRSIDAANDYNNEHEVGAAMTKCIEDGVLTREELFVQVCAESARPLAAS